MGFLISAVVPLFAPQRSAGVLAGCRAGIVPAWISNSAGATRVGQPLMRITGRPMRVFASVPVLSLRKTGWNESAEIQPATRAE
jgi:hypothetical protein